jgi:hypothetical protein
MAWDVLENTVISSFIMGLGRAIGVRYGRGPCEPIGVELLQQTPLDRCLGDLLIARARFVRLIEFKRELNKSRKERAKLRLLRTGLQHQPSQLELLSRQIHWYAMTNFNKEPSSTVVPYLDMEAPKSDRDLAQFVQETEDAMAGPGLTEQELEDLKLYMQAVAKYCGSAKSGGTVGGLLFAVNAQGKASYFPVHDVRELAMSPRLVVERRMTLKREMAQKLSMARRATLRQSHG